MADLHALSDRAHTWWAHAKQGAALAILIVVVLLGLEVRAAIRRASEAKAEQQAAVNVANPANVVDDAKLADGLWARISGRLQTELQRKAWAPPPRTAGQPFVPAPLAPNKEAGGTVAVPHPEVTTKTATEAPRVNVFQPTSAKEAAELASTFSLDLAKFYPITQRKQLAPEDCRYGCKLLAAIPAGGGDAFMMSRPNERPVHSFRPTLEIGAGPVVEWHGAPPNYGALVQVDLSVLRVGNWRLVVHGDAAMLPTAEDHLQGRVAVLPTYRWGEDQ